MNNDASYLVEMLATPLSGMFASMAIEDGEEALAAYGVEIDDEGVGILHGTTGALVFRDADAEGGMVGGMAIEDLWGGGEQGGMRGERAYPMCVQICGGYGLGAGVGGVDDGRGHGRCVGGAPWANRIYRGSRHWPNRLFLFSLYLSTLVHVSAIHRCKAFAPGRQNQSKEGCCKGTS